MSFPVYLSIVYDKSMWTWHIVAHDHKVNQPCRQGQKAWTDNATLNLRVIQKEPGGTPPTIAQPKASSRYCSSPLTHLILNQLLQINTHHYIATYALTYLKLYNSSFNPNPPKLNPYTKELSKTVIKSIILLFLVKYK